MRRWLAWTAENTAARAEEPRTRFARWTARRPPPAPIVPASCFQASDEPFPRHWRRRPQPWVDAEPADPSVQQALADALAELPATWRAVVVARDVDQQPAALVTDRLGLTAAQQRAILGRSREQIRRRMATTLGRGRQR